MLSLRGFLVLARSIELQSARQDYMQRRDRFAEARRDWCHEYRQEELNILASCALVHA